MTKRDLKIVLIFIIIAAIGLGGYGIYVHMNKKAAAESDEGPVVEIYYHSKLVHTMPFSEDDTYEIDGDYGHMVIQVEDNKVRVEDVECPNLICYYTGWVEQGTGTVICCVPNDIIVKERITSSD